MTFLPGLTDTGADGRAVMKDVLSKNVDEISKDKRKILVTVILRNKRTKL